MSIAIGTIDNITVGLNADNTVSVIKDDNFLYSDTFYISAAYVPISNKVIIAYFNEANNYSAIRIGTITENNILFSEEIIISENLIRNISIVHDSVNDKVVLVYEKYNGNAVSKIITIRDNTVLSSKEKIFKEKDIYSVSMTYDTVNGKVVIAYCDKSNDHSYGHGYIILGTVTENDISFSDPVVFNNGVTRLTSLTYDSVNNKVVVTYFTSYPQCYAASRVVSIEKDKILLGDKTIFDEVDVGYISTAYDFVSNKVIVVYYDDSDDRAYVNLGTVEGNKISFNTKTRIIDKFIYEVSVMHDIINNKIVIVYGRSHDLNAAKIGTIEGNNIMLSEETIFNEETASYMSAVYNSVDGKVIIAYNKDNNSYAAVRVGTVEGDNISFSPEIIFNDTNVRHISALYDQSNNKVIVAHCDRDSYGAIAVGTVNGDKILFNEPVVFIDKTIFDIAMVRIPIDNKLIIAYRDKYSDSGIFMIGTIEGDNITFEKETIFNNNPTYNISVRYDNDSNKVIIDYYDMNNNYNSTVIDL